MWFIGVEVEPETSAPPPKKNPGSAPVGYVDSPKTPLQREVMVALEAIKTPVSNINDENFIYF